MANALPREEHFTEAEYIAMEEHSEFKHEYINGSIYAMAGATGRHNDLAGNVFASLHQQLRGKSCKVRGSDQRLKIEATSMYTYPDVLVACPPLRYEGSGEVTLTDATVIIEVLSPSTAEYDRGAKYLHVQRLPSLRHYVLISQDRITVEHRWRGEDGDWKTEILLALDDIASLGAIHCTAGSS